MSRPRFTNQVVFITGGSSGLGAASAELFLQEGAKVFIADLEERNILERLGSENTKFQRCDVSSPVKCETAIKACVEAFGRLDVLFHNAGMPSGLNTIVDDDIDHFHKITNTNLHSLFYLSRIAIPQMRKQGKGAIVATASTVGLNGHYGLSSYSASKAGVINLIRTMAIDHAQENIRVNCVCPGYFITPMSAAFREKKLVHERTVARIPLGRGGEPVELGRTVLFLASDDASYITGQAISVDGGLTACGSPLTPSEYVDITV